MLTLCVSVEKFGLSFFVRSSDDELVLKLGCRSSDRCDGVLEAAIRITFSFNTQHQSLESRHLDRNRE